jgi:CheY-like chemotaxis protein
MARRGRVLVVEDDPGVREALAFVLEDRYAIVLASGGAEALGLVAREPVDLILMDWLLPDMSGADFLRALRRTLPGLPVITMSGLRADDVARQARAAGATLHLPKPLDVRELLAHIDRLLESPGYPDAEPGREPRAQEPAPLWVAVPGRAGGRRRTRGTGRRPAPDPGSCSTRRGRRGALEERHESVRRQGFPQPGAA